MKITKKELNEMIEEAVKLRLTEINKDGYDMKNIGGGWSGNLDARFEWDDPEVQFTTWLYSGNGIGRTYVIPTPILSMDNRSKEAITALKNFNTSVGKDFSKELKKLDDNFDKIVNKYSKMYLK